MGTAGSTGSALRVLREAQGLTLRDLAHMSGVSHGYIGLIERGKREPTPRVLRAIQEALAANLAGRGAA